MNASEFFLVFAFVTFVSTAVGFPNRDTRSFLGVILTLFAAIIACLSVSIGTPGRNPIVQLVVQIWRLDKTTIVIFLSSGMLGVVTGVAICSALRSWKQFGIVFLFYLGAISGFALLELKSSQSAESAGHGGQGTFFAKATVGKGFSLQRVGDLPIAPTSIVVAPDGSVLVAGYGGLAMQNGNIVRVTFDRKNAPKVSMVATYLTRPHGLAFWRGDLFVSRAGQFNRAENGQVVAESTGAITRLRDIDGDGTFDLYDDVVTGLPGAQNPDGLHQNNGIAFDESGNLYITVGAPSDHGPSVHPYAGTILRCQSDGSGLEVYAKGLRNPYDIAVTPAGVFCTDNDANNRNSGDEINLIRKGAHFGFPYSTVPNSVLSGADPPWLTINSAQGIAFVSDKTWGTPLGDSLLVAAYADGEIKRISLGKTKAVSRFASIPRVVDVVVGEGGAVYACSHDERAIYRITKVE